MRSAIGRWAARGLVIGAAAGGGCGTNSAPPLLRPEAFLNSSARPGEAPGVISKPVDQNGTVVYGELHAPLLPDEYTNPNPRGPTEISPLLQRATERPLPAPPPPQLHDRATAAARDATPAATMPAMQVAATSQPGTYQVVGTVLAVVDGRPVYADKVVARIEAELAADARKYTPDQFPPHARDEIEQGMLRNIAELKEIAIANEFLGPDDKHQADAYAQWWRGQQITAAGGSLELARQRAAEAGTTFEQQVQEERDKRLVQIYYQRVLIPKIQITVADLRRYYQQQLDTEFTRAAKAKFRLIKIDVAQAGGPEQAAAKSDRIIRQLKSGTDFASLARDYNDDSALMANGGEVGSVRKGDFAVEDVEKVVWKLRPGEFTDTPIQVRNDRGAALYLALLEERTNGAVQPFDDPVVQEKIREKLWSQQFNLLLLEQRRDLEARAVVVRNEDGMDAAVAIAIQRYPIWVAQR